MKAILIVLILALCIHVIKTFVHCALEWMNILDIQTISTWTAMWQVLSS